MVTEKVTKKGCSQHKINSKLTVFQPFSFDLGITRMFLCSWYLSSSCATVTLYVSAILASISFSNRLPPWAADRCARPRDMYDVTEISFFWWKSTNSDWSIHGWISTWLLKGLILHESRIVWTWALSKFDTPIFLIRPWSLIVSFQKNWIKSYLFDTRFQSRPNFRQGEILLNR